MLWEFGDSDYSLTSEFIVVAGRHLNGSAASHILQTYLEQTEGQREAMTLFSIYTQLGTSYPSCITGPFHAAAIESRLFHKNSVL